MGELLVSGRVYHVAATGNFKPPPETNSFKQQVAAKAPEKTRNFHRLQQVIFSGSMVSVSGKITAGGSLRA